MYNLTIRVNDEIADKLKKKAEQERRSINNAICVAIEKYTAEGENDADKAKNVVCERPN